MFTVKYICALITMFLQERVHLAQAVVLEHQEYLEAVRELTDWLMNAGEELQHWSDSSGDSTSIKRKLSEVRVSVTKTTFLTINLLHALITNTNVEVLIDTSFVVIFTP